MIEGLSGARRWAHYPRSAPSFVFDYGGQVTAPLFRRWSSRADKLQKSNSIGPASELQAAGGAEPLQGAVVVFSGSSKLELGFGFPCRSGLAGTR